MQMHRVQGTVSLVFILNWCLHKEELPSGLVVTRVSREAVTGTAVKADCRALTSSSAVRALLNCPVWSSLSRCNTKLRLVSLSRSLLFSLGSFWLTCPFVSLSHVSVCSNSLLPQELVSLCSGYGSECWSWWGGWSLWKCPSAPSRRCFGSGLAWSHVWGIYNKLRNVSNLYIDQAFCLFILD